MHFYTRFDTAPLVEFGFFFDLGIKSSQYQEVTAEYVEDFLRGGKDYKLSSLNDDVFFDILGHISNNIHRVYAGGAGIDRVQDFVTETRNNIQNGETHPLKEKWDTVIRFFSSTGSTRTPAQIVYSALTRDWSGKRPMIVVDLSKRPSNIAQSVWDEKIKPLLIDRFLHALIRSAESVYQDERSLNTLVVLDEAHRFAPQERPRNERFLRIKSNWWMLSVQPENTAWDGCF